MITCLTPTGDRPTSLALSRIYFERAKQFYLKQSNVEIEWLVVDDGITPFDPGGCRYLRRVPDGPNSLGRNLRFAFENGGLDAEFILIWEDDDWYAPSRIYNQVRQLNRYALHGYNKTVYYNINKGGYYRNENFQHSSLFETAMRREAAQQLQALALSSNPFLDILLWKSTKGKLDEHCAQAIGIKGVVGRPGLGCGHGDNLKYTPACLGDFIGGDCKNYPKCACKRFEP